MSDLLAKMQEILVAHNATQHRDLVRSALMTTEGFLDAVGDRLTGSELTTLGERCFRIEAVRLGMKSSDVDNHVRAHLDTQRLVEFVSKCEENSPSLPPGLPFELTKSLTPTPESHRAKRLAKWFRRLSPQGVRRVILQGDLKEVRTALSKRKPIGNDFCRALDKLSHHQVALPRWKRSVARCYGRLPRADRKQTRSAMLGFYSKLHDFKGLESLLPARPRQWMEVPLEMETYLHLKRLSKAKALAAFCESKFDPKKRFRYELPLRLALSRYYAHTGNYDAGLKQHSQMDTGNLWDYGDYGSLISITTNEALLIALKAQQEISKSAKTTSSGRDPVVVKEKRNLKQTISYLRALNRRLDANI